MLPEIGIMIGVYILTRNAQFLERAKATRVLADVSNVVAVIVIIDLFFRAV